ncbi:MAG TPA: ABC-2 family transporter protein [Bacillota bacterium]|nr:ABC-2 family transporter protein [Bacillota bacterium]HPE37948.1 ABC-2 family transporter protein [Bacillota bacterium]
MSDIVTKTKERPKRGLLFYPKIYLMIASQDIKSKMSYRSDFWISTIGMIATNVSGFIGFWLIFQSFQTINGWTYYEMLFLYAFSLLALTPGQIFFDNNWSLRQYVYSGDFVKYCFRPINLFFYFMSEVIDAKGIGQLAFSIVLLVWSWIEIGIPVTFASIVIFLCAIFSASLIMIAIMTAASASCFWIMNSGYLMVYMFAMKDYAKYPITIFSGVFRIIFTFIIPIAYIAYYPSLLLIRPLEADILTFLTPVISVALFFGAYRLWMYGASKYSGTGS